MIGENIKTFRKQKGYSQETLALQLNVVRQTVSKWEKGLSVPDAEMLEKLAEVLEVSAADLLGSVQGTSEAGTKAEAAQKIDTTEIANQLAILNENLAQQARSRQKTRRLVRNLLLSLLIGLAALILIAAIAARLFIVLDAVDPSRLTTTEITCTVDGTPHSYTILNDGKQTLLPATGSPWFEETFQADGVYANSGQYTADIIDYCSDNGIPCVVTETDATNPGNILTTITCTVIEEEQQCTLLSDAAGDILSIEASPWFTENFSSDVMSIHDYVGTIRDYCTRSGIPCRIDSNEQ